MTYTDDPPIRVRVLVLGGGIHGCGVLHDLVSRGWHDVHLVEKSKIGSGTSSKSTKLIHGGLRYLQRMSDFGLVTEGLNERRLLMELAPDLVKPVEFLFPVIRNAGMPRWMVKFGLSIYDKLAGRNRLGEHRLVSSEEVAFKAPQLDQDKCKVVYSFWDCQTDDLALVQRVAASAHKMGATISEHLEVVQIEANPDGWTVVVRKADGSRCAISALYVVNCLGPWANLILEKSGIPPNFRGLNNKGAHLLLPDIGLKSGLFLQSLKADGRIFFVLPWLGSTLVGTTEVLYTANPDRVRADERDIEYLLDNCNQFLRQPLVRSDVRQVFAGLRWLAVEEGRGLSDTSRHHVLGERISGRGLIITLYGGKLTAYRDLAQSIGDRILEHFGEFKASGTANKATWVTASDSPPVLAVDRRFERMPVL